MDNVRKLYSGYGDMPPWGKGPKQGPIHNRGSSYIEEEFPLLDRFETCSVKRMTSSPQGDDLAHAKDVMSGTVEDPSHGFASGQGNVEAGSAKESPRLRASRYVNEQMVDAPSTLLWKIAELGSLLGIVYQICVRRRRSKQVGKSN